MKKYKKIAYIIFIIFAIILGFTIYKVYGKNDGKEDVRSKALAEVKKLEGNFENIFNELNNIKFENYTISSTEIKKEETSQNNTMQKNGSSSSSEGGSNSSSGESGGNSSQSSETNKENESNKEKDNKKYTLKEEGVLINEEDINWDNIKIEVEQMYISLPTMTLDLYETNVDRQEITNFNTEYDKLTKSVKDENKEDTLSELSDLYEYLTDFTEKVADNESEIVITKTKNEIFKAYSMLDKEEWTTILDNISSANQEFRKLLTNTDNQKNQYNINKTYVMLNELQNCVTLKDKEIFLIKYKNLLEELQKL